MFTGRFDDNCSRSDGVIISTEVHGTLNNKNMLIFGFDTQVGKTSTVKVLKPEAGNDHTHIATFKFYP